MAKVTVEKNIQIYVGSRTSTFFAIFGAVVFTKFVWASEISQVSNLQTENFLGTEQIVSASHPDRKIIENSVPPLRPIAPANETLEILPLEVSETEAVGNLAENKKLEVKKTEAIKSEIKVGELDDSQDTADANLEELLKPEKQTVEEPSLWQGGVLVGCMLFGLAGLGFVLVRLKNKGALPLQSREKHMQISSTLALSPKRQVLLVRIRDQEFALASTEHGIQFLSEVGAQNSNQNTTQNSGQNNSNQIPSGSKMSQVQDQIPPRLMRRTEPQVEQKTEAQSAPEPKEKVKSDMLKNALSRFKDSEIKREKNEAPEKSPSSLAANKRNSDATATQSTLKSTRANFPKYLANTFAQESERVTAPKGNLNLNQNQHHNPDEDVESVTNMIRAKLKEMKPLA